MAQQGALLLRATPSSDRGSGESTPVLPAIVRALPGLEPGHCWPSPSLEAERPASHSSQCRLPYVDKQTLRPACWDPRRQEVLCARAGLAADV